MKRNLIFKTLRPSVLVALLCLTGIPLAQTPVEVKTTIKGGRLLIDFATRGPEPTLRMNPDPSFLELSFPNSVLKSKAFKKAIDKGLIQKVVASQADRTTLARVYVLSKPKASLSKTDTGYRYSVNLNEMASAPTRNTAKPAARKPAASKPVTTKPVTTKPVSTKPTVTAEPNVSSQPATTRTVSTPPAATTSKPATQPAATTAAAPKTVREYFPFSKKSASKAMEAARLAFPNLSYAVDPALNILMVEGSPGDIAQLEKFLRAQSPK